ncbi:MAG: hypothetical protein WCF78_01345 [archaeon]
MNYKLFIITPLLILLIILSGCVHLLSTAEREACLSATHFSTNSIDVCETQKECYTKIVDNQNISDKLPISIYNRNIVYLNNIASASFNFNQSTKYLKELNKSCDAEDVNKIIKSSNDLFSNLRNIFEYIDNANSESIILIKDYVIYLESEGIDKIPEEKIYDEYILLNNNLNELKVDSDNENYVHNLLDESAKLNLIAKDFGFEKNYISNVNYVDLTAYYFKLIENPSGEVRVPTIIPGFNYVLGELSNLEQLRSITVNLQRADNYNFYIVLDKFIGKNNSLYTSFTQISTNINKEISEIYVEIADLEIEIEKNTYFLSQENYVAYNSAKTDFRDEKLGFGTYLSMLKNIKTEIELNTINEIDQNTQNIETIKDCDLIIKSAEKINNTYLNKLIKDYKKETNFNTKLIICSKITFEINNTNCIFDLDNILNLDTSEFNSYKEIYRTNVTQEDCINILNNINNYLENNEKINLLKEIIRDNVSKLIEINEKTQLIDLNNKITITDINTNISKISNEPNYRLYIDIDKKIKEQKSINDELLDVAKEIEKRYLQNNYKIELVDSNYYLILSNIFLFELNNLEIEINELDSNIYFYTAGIKINKNKLTIDRLFINKNHFQINYQNKKEITTKLIELDLDNTLFEITIKNQIEGITDKIYIPLEKKLVTGLVDEKNYLYYVTETENKILYTQDIFSNTILSNVFEQLTNDKFVNKLEIKIKNNYEKDILGRIKLIDVDSSADEYIAYLLKINNREQDAYLENRGIYTEINLSKGEEKIYELQTLFDFNEVILIAKDNLLEMQRLENSRFLDLKKLAITEFSSVDDLSITHNSKIEEIQLLFSKDNKINQIKNKELEYAIAEDAFFILFNRLASNEKLSLVNKNKIDKLNDTKYTNIVESLRQLKLIEKSHNIEVESKDIETDITNYAKLQELKLKISDYNINDDVISELILNVDYKNQTDLNFLEQKINDQLKIQTIEISKLIQTIDEINTNTETNFIEKIRWVFEDFSLDELYTQHYFPGITTADLDRYKKKQSFLDTQTLNKEVTEFKFNLDSKDYEGAINSMSDETKNRLKDIVSEYKFINDEFEKIKIDSKNKLNAYIEENQDTHKQEIKDKITLAKEYYSNGKYLNTISVLKEEPLNSKIIINNQLIIISTILLIIILLGLYFRIGTKRKKELNFQERKKRVIRHN